MQCPTWMKGEGHIAMENFSRQSCPCLHIMKPLRKTSFLLTEKKPKTRDTDGVMTAKKNIGPPNGQKIFPTILEMPRMISLTKFWNAQSAARVMELSQWSL